MNAAGRFDATFNLPISGIAVLLGADAVMDMARTSVNLLGNCMAAAVVARWEGVDLSVTREEQVQVQAV